MLAAALAAASIVVFKPQPLDGSAAPGDTPVLPSPTTSESATDVAEPEEEFVVVKSRDRRSEISVPKSWEKPPKDEQAEGAQIQRGHPYRAQTIVVFAVEKSDFASFADFARVIPDLAREELKNFKLVYRRDGSIGGLPTVRFAFTGTYKGANGVYWEAAIRGKKAYYHVVGWTLPSERDEARPVILKVIDSFRETTTGA